MKSLADCLEIHSDLFTKEEKDELLARAKDYREEDYDGHQADVMSVESMVDEASRELEDIKSQVRLEKTVKGGKPKKRINPANTKRFVTYAKAIGGIRKTDKTYRGELNDLIKGNLILNTVIKKNGLPMDEFLAAVKERNDWSGMIETEDDVLEALANNPERPSIIEDLNDLPEELREQEREYYEQREDFREEYTEEEIRRIEDEADRFIEEEIGKRPLEEGEANEVFLNPPEKAFKEPTELTQEEEIQGRIRDIQQEAYDLAAKEAEPWSPEFKKKYELYLQQRQKQIDALEEELSGEKGEAGPLFGQEKEDKEQTLFRTEEANTTPELSDYTFEQLIELGDTVKAELKKAGISDEMLDKVTVDLRDYVELRGNYQRSLEEHGITTEEVEGGYAWLNKDTGERSESFKTKDEATQDYTRKKVLGSISIKRGRAVIQFALNLQDIDELKRTAKHEGAHLIFDWLCTDKQKNFLISDYGTVEKAVDGFVKFIENRESIKGKPMMVRYIFTKVKKFLTAIGNALQGKGFQATSLGIFENIVEGKMEPHYGGTEEHTQFAVARTADNPKEYAKNTGAKESFVQMAQDKISSTTQAFKEGKAIPPGGFLDKALTTPEWTEHPIEEKVMKGALRRESNKHTVFYEIDWDPVEKMSSTVFFKSIKNEGMTFSRVLSRELYDVNKANVSEKYKKAWKIIDRMDILGRQWFDKEGEKGYRTRLIERKIDPDVIKFVDMFRRSRDRELDFQRKTIQQVIEDYKLAGEEAPPLYKYKDKDGEEKEYTLFDAYNDMGTLEGSYAPRHRPDGDWVVAGRRYNKLNYVYREKSRRRAIELSKKLKRQGYKNVEYYEDTSKLPESTYESLSVADVAKALESAVGKMKDVSPTLQSQFRMEILQSAARELQARALRSHRIARKKGAVYRGYIEDPLTRHVLSSTKVSGGIAKGIAAKEMIDAYLGVYRPYKRDDDTDSWVLEGDYGYVIDSQPMTEKDKKSKKKTKSLKYGGMDPNKERDMHTKLREYIGNQLRNDDKYDRAVGLAKSIVSFRYLGFNPRSMAVNVTAMLQTAPAAIHQYAMGGKGSMIKIMKAIATAGKDYAQVMSGKKGNLTDDERAFIDEIKKQGWDAPQYMHDALGAIHDLYGGTWSNIMSASMKGFGISEQWNRGSTMLAAYRMARKQGVSIKEATDRAVDASNKAHGIYAKATQPVWTQGQSPFNLVFRMGYTYQKFAHNYLQLLGDLGFRKQNYKAMAFALAAPAVIGGMKSSLVAGVLFMLARTLWPEDDPEKMVYDTIREELGPLSERVARYGLFGGLGVEISGSLAIGMEVPKTLIDLMGPFGGLYQDIDQSVQYLQTGQPYRAISKVTPRAVENIMMGAKETKTGALTKKGYPIWDETGRKQYQPGMGETAWKMAGFRGSKRATTQEREWESKRIETVYREKRDRIYQEYRSIISSGKLGTSKYVNLLKKIQEYNKEVRDKDLKGLIPLITTKSLKGQVRRMTKPSKRDIARKRATG